MTDFFLRAWRNPVTTFTLGGAILGVLALDLADGQPLTFRTGLKVAIGVVGVLGACAAKDAAQSAPATGTPQ